MARMIAVWGSPNSGKTTFAVKLASAVYNTYQSTVIVICPDMEAPTLPVLFPNRKKEDMPSLGVALSRPEITPEEVAAQILVVKGARNFGFLGYRDGETRFTYPRFDAKSAASFYSAVSGLADVVIVDCTSSLTNLLTPSALIAADTVIRLYAPTLKSVSWMSSQLPLYADPLYRLDRQIQGLNVPCANLYMPVEEAKAHIPDLRFTVPYSRAVGQQMLDGKLWEKGGDAKFCAVLDAIAVKAVNEN